MPQLSRRKRKSSGPSPTPRKRIRHVTPKRLSQLYHVSSKKVDTLSQEFQEKVKEVLGSEVTTREALGHLQATDLDVNKAVENYCSSQEENVDEIEEFDDPPAGNEDEDDEKQPEGGPVEPEDPLGPPIEDIEQLEDPVPEREPEAKELEAIEISPLAAEKGLTHFLSVRFTQNALEVFKDCISVVSRIQEDQDAVVMKLDNKHKKIKFWCRSSGFNKDVIEFIFENKGNPRCFCEFKYSYDPDRVMHSEKDNFELGVPLGHLKSIAKKIDVKKHLLNLDFHNDTDPTNCCVRFAFENRDDSQRFDYRISKINVESVDPMLSQFHSVSESQERNFSQDLNASIQEEDALVTLYTSTQKFKEAHQMFVDVSDIINFQIVRQRPDTQDLSEPPDEFEDKYEVRLKSKSQRGGILVKASLPLRGGPNLQSIHVKPGKEIKDNVQVNLPTKMVGKILNLKFIHNTTKIDFYEVDKVRFIFKFARSKCLGRLYYNVEPEPAEDLDLLMDGAAVAASEIDEIGESAPSPKVRRKKRRIRNSLSAIIDKVDSDNE